MTVKELLLLGNPDLYEKSVSVEEDEMDTLVEIVKDLHDTLLDFCERYGVGRAIAAPQIGVKKRIIYLNIDSPVVFINPEIVEMSPKMIELWDDCMSFPDLRVKVKRHKSCRINYNDSMWNHQSLFLDDDMSELLQHEYDHLEGVLAIDRAIDLRSISYKSEVSS